MAKWADIRWALAQYSAPAVEPLTYSEVNTLLQLPTASTDQTWLTSRIKAARRMVEEDTGRRLISQVVDMTLDAFPDDGIWFPVLPLASVTSIAVTSSAGASSVVASSNYIVDTANGRIALSDSGEWPGDIRTVAGIVVRATVGYGAASTAVPEPLIWAMEQLLAQWYASRVGTAYVAPPRWLGYDATIAPYRVRGLG